MSEPCKVRGMVDPPGVERSHQTERLWPDDEVVICAAVLSDDGQVLRCHRHHDGLRALADRELAPAEHERAQGFVTSRNRYVDRTEAMQLQLDAGIESAAPGGYRGETLFSEDLY